MRKKRQTLSVQGTSIQLYSDKQSDFICITDIAKMTSNEPRFIIRNWLSTKNTISYLGEWESIHNTSFNRAGFLTVRDRFFNNAFSLSVSYWCDQTKAIGVVSKAGRYGGTFAHKDIALNFCYWLNPTFQIYFIKEFQRLKEIEYNKYNLEWNVKRILTKTNYLFQTDAIQQFILPKIDITKDREWIVYAEEADILNVALFGCTARQWRDANTEAAQKNMNIRDTASINELAVLSNLESLNAELIKQEIDKRERFERLYDVATYQLTILNEKDSLKSLKKKDDKS